jgi:hypothetical protein
VWCTSFKRLKLCNGEVCYRYKSLFASLLPRDCTACFCFVCIKCRSLRNNSCRKRRIIAIVNFAADMVIGGCTLVVSLNDYYMAGGVNTAQSTRNFAFLGLSLALSGISLSCNISDLKKVMELARTSLKPASRTSLVRPSTV